MKFKLLVFLSFLLPITVLAATKSVLVTDTNGDGKISELTVQNGEDLIIVKKNPPVLKSTDTVLQTKNYNFYTAASLDDLKAPNAERKLLLAKMLSNGFIKVYTLANAGYTSIQVTPNDKGDDTISLVKFRGSIDKVNLIEISAPEMQTYRPTVKSKKPIKGR